jgi:hypothetical protein
VAVAKTCSGTGERSDPRADMDRETAHRIANETWDRICKLYGWPQTFSSSERPVLSSLRSAISGS